GLIKFDGAEWVVFNTSNSGIQDNQVTALSIDNNGVKYVGTNSGGLSLYDDLTWINYNHSGSGLPADNILSVNTDSESVKWVGTISGLVKLENEQLTQVNTASCGLPQNSVSKVAIDEYG